MNRVLCFIVAVAMSCSVALADTRQKVTNIENDENAYSLTIFGTDGEPTYEQMKASIRKESTRNLALERSVHFAELDSASTMYKTRYAPTTPGLPCIRLQDSTGKVIYQATGRNVPSDGIEQALRACPRRFFNRNEQKQEQVEPLKEVAPPTDQSTVDVSIGAQADVQPDVPLEPENDNAVLAAIVGAGLLVGAGGGVVKGWKKAHG